MIIKNLKLKMKNVKLLKLFSCTLISLITLLPYYLITLTSPVHAQITLGPIEGYPGAYEPGGGIEGAGTSLAAIFTNTLGVMTIIAGLMFMVYFILGGLSWLSASGKAEQVQKAKQQMTNAVIGLIIVVAAYGIAYIVGTVLGIPILQPQEFLYRIMPGGVSP